jgi:hypothetical protein
LLNLAGRVLSLKTGPIAAPQTFNKGVEMTRKKKDKLRQALEAIHDEVMHPWGGLAELPGQLSHPQVVLHRIGCCVREALGMADHGPSKDSAMLMMLRLAVLRLYRQNQPETTKEELVQELARVARDHQIPYAMLQEIDGYFPLRLPTLEELEEADRL